MRKIVNGLVLAMVALCSIASASVAQGAPAAASAPAPQAAPAAPTYAFLSLVGDKLDIVIAQFQTGSNLDKNRREPPLEIADPVFDNVAATSAGEGVRKVIPRAELAILNSRSPVLFAKQKELFAEQNGVVAIPDAIRTALKNEKADFLVLITKLRAESEFQFTGFPDGGGLIEGLGFYVDGFTGVYNRETSEAGRGYIAPFAYMQVAVIDAQSGKLIGKQKVKASMVISSARAQEGQTSPWAALTSAEKVSAINRLIQREMQRVVPLILRGEAGTAASGAKMETSR